MATTPQQQNKRKRLIINKLEDILYYSAIVVGIMAIISNIIYIIYK